MQEKPSQLPPVAENVAAPQPDAPPEEAKIGASAPNLSRPQAQPQHLEDTYQAQEEKDESHLDIGLSLLTTNNEIQKRVAAQNKATAMRAVPICRKYAKLHYTVKRSENNLRVLCSQLKYLPEMVKMVEHMEKRVLSLCANLDKMDKLSKKFQLERHEKKLVQIDTTTHKELDAYQAKKDRELRLATDRIRKQQEALELRRRREAWMKANRGAPASMLEVGTWFFKTSSIPRTAKQIRAEVNNPNDNTNTSTAPFARGPVIKKTTRETVGKKDDDEKKNGFDPRTLPPPPARTFSNPSLGSGDSNPQGRDSAAGESDTETSSSGSPENQNILDDAWGDGSELGSEAPLRFSVSRDKEQEAHPPAPKPPPPKKEEMHPIVPGSAFRAWLREGGWDKYFGSFLRAGWGQVQLLGCSSPGDLIMVGVLPRDAPQMIEWLNAQARMSSQKLLQGLPSPPTRDPYGSDPDPPARGQPLDSPKKRPHQETLEVKEEAEESQHASAFEAAKPPDPAPPEETPKAEAQKETQEAPKEAKENPPEDLLSPSSRGADL